MSTPTQRSLKKLRDAGWTVCSVEKWIAQIKQRKDAFNFGDLLAMHPLYRRIMLVQTTSGSNGAARVKKIEQTPEAKLWQLSGGFIEVHAWVKKGAKGKRKLWECNVTAMSPIYEWKVPPPPEPIFYAVGGGHGGTA